MEKSAVQLKDLMDLQQLQALQDCYAKMTGLMTVLVDATGHRYTCHSNLSPLFSFLEQASPKQDMHLTTNRKIAVKNRGEKASVVVPCGLTGMPMGGSPIFYEGVHLGSWVVGPARFGDVDEEILSGTANKLGVDPEKSIQAAKKIPRISEKTFYDALAFLDTLSTTVVSLAENKNNIAKTHQNLMELTEELDSTAQMLTKFTNSADVGMYVTDFFTGEVLQANAYLADFMHTSMEEIVGTQCWRLYYPDGETFCEECPHDRLLDERGHPDKPIIWERYYADRERWMQFTNQAIYWVDGRLAHMVTFIDITQNKLMQKQLQRLAYYDKAMRLPNTLKLLQDLEEMDAQIRKEYCLICFDVVSLRTINDVYGRDTGDLLLKAVAGWAQGVRQSDSALYRVEGDEFCLVVRCQDFAGGQKVAAKIRSRFEEPWIFKTSGEELHIFCNVSVGVIYLKDHVADGDQLLSTMERTLTSAKKTGRLAVYDESMDEEYREHLKLELSLKTCVKEGMRGFEVFYQPIVNPITGKWSSLEALCRWNSPECGFIPPLVFIHEAEQMGLIGVVGRWVLEQAITQCKKWGLDQLEGFMLDVNLSPAQVTEETLVSSVIHVLEQHEFPGEKLSLEITESAEMNFSDHTMNAIERLRSAHVQVALDDFGTGYSSLNNLKNLPVSILKTERVFIENIENDNYLQYLFYVMVELAHAADMKIIAEGVESPEQLQILMKNGVDYLQGFLFSRPLSASELGDQLHNFYENCHPLLESAATYYMESKRTQDSNYLSISPSLYRLLIQCIQILLSSIDADEAMLQVLEIVGLKFGFSRTHVFWQRQDDIYDMTNEWCAVGMARRIQHMPGKPLRELCPSFLALLKEDNIVQSSQTSELPLDIRRILEPQDIRSIVVLPMWGGEELKGFVSFDDNQSNRKWLPEETMMLRNLCMVIQSVMEKHRLQKKMEQQGNILSTVLNSMDISAYVTDLSSYKILFANDKIKESFGQVEGELCWKTLQGEDGICSACKVEWLLQNPAATKCVWETYDEKSCCHYKVYDSIINWTDGHKVHLEYAMDITELKYHQRQLEKYASMDVFTGTLNRNTLLERLQEMLYVCNQEGTELIVCFVDVDRLKYFNDTFGHVQGDMLLLSTVRALKQQMGDGDIIGRYGGDEFVLTLSGMDMEQAAEQMRQAQLRLLDDNPHAPDLYSFSYGMVSSGLFSYDDSEGYVEKLLEIADKSMFSDKKRKIQME